MKTSELIGLAIGAVVLFVAVGFEKHLYGEAKYRQGQQDARDEMKPEFEKLNTIIMEEEKA